MKTKSIKYQGFKYYYRIFENKNQEIDPVFFVSGAFQDMDSWKLLSDYFIPKTTVILADLPGMGMADYLPDDYNIDFLVDCLYQIFEEAGLKKVYMISASYGTILGYKFAKKYPEKISMMTLGGTMKKLPQNLKDIIAQSMALAKAGKTNEFAEYVLKNGLMYNGKSANQKIANYEKVYELVHRQLSNLDESLTKKFVSNTKRLLNESQLEINHSLKINTLIFTGEYDVFTSPESCRNFALQHNNSTFTTIKKADHLYHLEQTMTTIELLYRFGKGLNLEGIENCNEIEFFKFEV